MRILILEDDKSTASFLSKAFFEIGYNVELCCRGDEALELAQAEEFDIAVVDIMVPGLNGVEVVEKLRRHGHDMPVLFLSAKREIADRIEGLQRGGDDYLTKPFSFSELLARCQAILRRTAKQMTTHILNFADIEMDLFSRTVYRNRKPIDLQQKEFALLEYFLRNPGRVLTKTQILERVWSYNFDPQTNVVDVLVCRLRNKLDRDHAAGKLIKTIRGVGYVLRTE